MLLLALAACTPEKPPFADTASDDTAAPDTAPDSGDTDTGDTGDTDTGPAPDTGDSDTAACATELSSDEAVSAGDCKSVTPICAAGACTLDVDLDLVTVSGALTGVDPASGDWWLTFQDPRIVIDGYNPVGGSTWGTAAPFGSVAIRVESAAFALGMFPGVYDVALMEGDPGDGPTQHFPLAAEWALTGDVSLDVALTLHAVQGEVLLDGAPIGGAPWVEFRDAGSGAYAKFPVTDGAFAARLPDGTWDAVVRATDTAGLASGEHAVGTVVVAGADVTEDLVVEAYRVGGSILIGGAPLPDPGEDSVHILRFVDDAGREMETHLGAGDTWSARLPPGTWTAHFPSGYVLSAPFDVTGDATVDLAEQLVTASGTLAVNGGAPGEWYLNFVDPSIGVGYLVEGAAWTAELHPGTYDVYARRSTSAATLLAEGVVVEAGTELGFSFEVASVVGEVSVNGRRPSVGWTLVFMDVETGAKTYGRATGDAAWETQLRLGVYDVYVLLERWTADLAVPVARGLTVDGDTCLALDVPTYEVGGAVLLDGALPLGGDDVWSLVTNQPGSGETVIDIFDAADPTWSVDLPAGVYTFLAAFDSLHEADTRNFVPVAVCVEIGPS